MTCPPEGILKHAKYWSNARSSEKACPKPPWVYQIPDVATWLVHDPHITNGHRLRSGL